MSQWLVTQGDHQFAVDGIGQLKQMARGGNLKAGDMIQPPGASDWIYAIEIEELKGLLRDAEDEPTQGGGVHMPLVAALAGGLLVVTLVFGGVAAVMSTYLPSGEQVLIGEGGLGYSEMIVTAHGASLVSDPDPSGRVIASLEKDQVLDLLAKRGPFYKARTKQSLEGWVRFDQVLPMYQLGGAEVRAEYDPLYNPDRYVDVANASWMMLPEQAKDHITVFQFMLKNNTDYAMADLVILATIKDARGHELEKVEIPIEGEIPARGATMVGMLQPDSKGRRRKPKPGEEAEPPRLLTQWTFDEMAKADPELQLRYSVGVEVQMSTSDFTNANIDILEIRAIPNAPAVATQR